MAMAHWGDGSLARAMAMAHWGDGSLEAAVILPLAQAMLTRSAAPGAAAWLLLLAPLSVRAVWAHFG